MKILNRVCSLGGVASSSILRHIENNNDYRIREHEKRKHTIHPKYLVELGAKKVLFLIGNPYNSIISIFNRKLARRHEISMNFGKLWFQNKQEMTPILNKNTTLEEYLELGVDVFNMNEHLENWINYKKKDLDILIIKYENLEQHVDEAMKFFNCKRKFEVKNRNSNWESMPDAIKSDLQFVYSDIKRKIDSLPSIIKKINKTIL